MDFKMIFRIYECNHNTFLCIRKFGPFIDQTVELIWNHCRLYTNTNQSIYLPTSLFGGRKGKTTRQKSRTNVNQPNLLTEQWRTINPVNDGRLYNSGYRRGTSSRLLMRVVLKRIRSGNKSYVKVEDISSRTSPVDDISFWHDNQVIYGIVGIRWKSVTIRLLTVLLLLEQIKGRSW